ncbi:MAG TPA: hypothetical protein VKX17_03340 [Planctomycetota bacterium]|nr:hypothetical protein [Planctomycetota bacterium]
MIPRNQKFNWVLLILAGAWSASRAMGAAPPEPLEAEWRKIETKPAPINAVQLPYLVMTPGAFDKSLFHIITFPVNGAAVDTELPHFGNDKDGKPHPALMAKYAQGTIWIDFNGDGKADSKETRAIKQDGWTDPFTCELFFEDGTSSNYTFRIKQIAEKEKYQIVRFEAKSFQYNGKTVTIFDDDGNGKYNDAGRDSVLVEGQPVCLLGKYMQIGDALVELIVHASGSTVEVRPAPKDLALGAINPFDKYVSPQNSEDLKIHTLIFSGPEGAFSFDATHRTAKVPVGAYDLSFGLFERHKEIMYVHKGEKSSFNVTANVVSQPAWGAKVKIKFTITSDGEEVTLSAPHFIGQMSEEYFPELGKALQGSARLTMVYHDRTHFDIEQLQQFGQHKLDLLPDGDFKPTVFKRYRNYNDDYEGIMEYTSGIIGRVEGKERFSFTYKKKDPAKK